MHEPLLSHHHLSEDLSSTDRRFFTAERSARRSTLQALQPPPPLRLPQRAASLPLTSSLITVEEGSASRAAGHRGAPQVPTFYNATVMNPRTQGALVMPHLGAPDSCERSTLDRNLCQSEDLSPERQGSLRKRSGGVGAVSEDRPRCSRTGSGATLTAATRIAHMTTMSDEEAHNSVSGNGGPSGRNDTPLTIDYSCSPLTLGPNSASVNNSTKKVSSAKSADSASIGNPACLRLTPPEPLLRGVLGPVALNATQSKMLPSASAVNPEVVTTPLSLVRQALPSSPSGVSHHRSGRSRKNSFASLSAASNISVEDLSHPHHTRRESSACSSCTDTGTSGFSRPALNRRVHFLLEDSAEGGGLASADRSTTSPQCSDATRARLPLCSWTSSMAAPTPWDTDQKTALSVSSGSNNRPTMSALPESLNGSLPIGSSLSGATMRPASSSLSLDRSPIPNVKGGGASFSLHLNKKEGRIEATPAFSPGRRLGNRVMRATEDGGAGFNSALCTTSASVTGPASSRSGYSKTHASATYQPSQPLPKPALKQVSRYSEGWSAEDSRTSFKLVKEGNDQWSWWQSNAAAGAGTTAAGSPGRPSSKSVMGQHFTSYLQGALNPRQRHRVRTAEEASAIAGKAAEAGGFAAGLSSTTSGRAGGRRERRAELLVRLRLVKWSLMLIVVFAFFAVFFEFVVD
ncbi:hypothetical protein, unknown function [Leishmania tarentolae]|uniref:Transmembrane protein n=1 Tax=Leishmania tarentolae TaxID=5689 RepID=A0A640KHX0_LEITA|nr:hypothetical protein, unknown function [Leishmania tarentolae]